MKAYEVITQRIIDLLESGVVPWRRPWRSLGDPCNLISRQPYKGSNWLVLSCAGFASSWFLTFKQAQDLGGRVRAGEHGFPVVYWTFLKKAKTGESSGGDNEVDDEEKVPFARYSTVFNVEQTDGIKVPEPESLPDFVPLEQAAAVVSGYQGPTIEHEGGRAYYRRSTDTVRMPVPGSFINSESYYGTLFHELIHSTLIPARCNRPAAIDPQPFGSPDYAKEELVAEIGAAFLSQFAGLDGLPLEQSASYIDNWLGVLRKDKRVLVSAAGQAQKAADFILKK